MTQVQLAEAMGVTVGAVYKWESQQSNPDLNLIIELADLFEVSTDVLLGYEWRNGSMGVVLDRIIVYRQRAQYDEGILESEKALKKYPNCFDIVYLGKAFTQSLDDLDAIMINLSEHIIQADR